MLLVIDVGNTNIVVGVFDGERLVADFRLHTNERATGDELGLTTTELLRRRGIEVGAVSALAVANVVHRWRGRSTRCRVCTSTALLWWSVPAPAPGSASNTRPRAWSAPTASPTPL